MFAVCLSAISRIQFAEADLFIFQSNNQIKEVICWMITYNTQIMRTVCWQHLQVAYSLCLCIIYMNVVLVFPEVLFSGNWTRCWRGFISWLTELERDGICINSVEVFNVPDNLSTITSTRWSAFFHQSRAVSQSFKQVLWNLNWLETFEHCTLLMLPQMLRLQQQKLWAVAQRFWHQSGLWCTHWLRAWLVSGPFYSLFIVIIKHQKDEHRLTLKQIRMLHMSG